MNAQEIFTKVKDHLLTQGKRAYDPEQGICMYRQEDSSCAIGCLIPDELYDPCMEGEALKGVINILHLKGNDKSTALGNLFEEHKALLAEMQSVHDDASVVNWSDALAEVAEEFGLEF